MGATHRYPTADSAAEAYFRAHEELTSTPAQRLSTTVEGCGQVVGTLRLRTGERVPVYCHGPKSSRVRRIVSVDDGWLDRHEAREWVDICARCGSPWRPEDRALAIMRGEVRIRGRIGWEQGGGRLVRAQTPTRPGLGEGPLLARIDVMRLLRPLIETPPRDRKGSDWKTWLLGYSIFLVVGSFEETSRVIREGTRSETPTAAKTEKEINRTRATIQARLERRGALKTWTREEVEAEIRRLEKMAATAPHLDRIGIEKAISRLKRQIGQANGRAA